MTVSDGKGIATFTGSPTYSFWFHCFMTGCHQQMGDTWIPDRAITLDEVLHAFILLEEDWEHFGSDWTMGGGVLRSVARRGAPQDGAGIHQEVLG